MLANLAISPNLQALLEFDDRLRTPNETPGRSGAAPPGLTQDGQHPSWTQQEVPTAPLPPPRRKKNAVADVPVSPKTISDLQRVPSPTDSLPEIGEVGGFEEIIFAKFEDELEDDEMGLGLGLTLKGAVNPYLNSPPSSPRYFYPLSDDEEERIDRPRSRSTRRHVRQRSFSGDQPPGERKGGKFVPPRYFTSFRRKAGSKPKQKGKLFSLAYLFPLSHHPLAVLPSKISVTRAAATRPLLLHSHKASFSSSHSHQVRSPLNPFRAQIHISSSPLQTGSSYEPSSSPEPPISISRYISPLSFVGVWPVRSHLMWLPSLPLYSTVYSASSLRSLSIPPSVSPDPIQGSFIDLASPPMSPASDVWSYEPRAAKSTSRNHSPRSPNPSSRSSSPSQKPPIPTTPKPVFNRPRSIRKSSDGKPKAEDLPTTILSFAERADLVKRTRKLTQLFGQTPGPEFASLSPVVASSVQQSHLGSDVRRGHRAIASISNPLHPSDRGVWPPPEETLYLNIHGRRHSTPLSPTTVSTMWGSNEEDSVLDHDQRSFYSDRHSKMRPQRKGTSSSSIASSIPSPMSFIDLSDDESAVETPKDIIGHHRRAPFSKQSTIDDTASLSTLTSTQIHEGERRRKREKLVKLHRFLGSRVPPDLALGFDLGSSPQLPPSASPEIERDDTRKRFRVRKRRSTSLSEYTRPLTTREDRMKSELDMQEKALNVRRAAKMEKVGGSTVTLYTLC